MVSYLDEVLVTSLFQPKKEFQIDTSKPLEKWTDLEIYQYGMEINPLIFGLGMNFLEGEITGEFLKNSTSTRQIRTQLVQNLGISRSWSKKIANILQNFVDAFE